MTVLDLLALGWRWIRLIILGVLAGAAVAGCVIVLGPASYTATSIAYVRVTIASTGDGTSATSQLVASQLAERRAKALVLAVPSEGIAQGVVDALGLDVPAPQLAKDLSADYQAGADTVSVHAQASTPELARQIADEAVRQANVLLAAVGGQESYQVVIMTSAQQREAPRSPQTRAVLALGALSGAVLTYLGALLAETASTRVRTPAEARDAAAVPVLAQLPHTRRFDGSGGVVGTIEEELRRLRAAVRHACDGRLILVTSAGSQEGRSSVCLGLARAVAATGQRVTLLEADLRRPVLAARLRVRADHPGLAQVLAEEVDVEQALVDTSVPELKVLPAGAVLTQADRALASPRLLRVLEVLGAQGVVIIDSPPLAQTADAVVLASHADATLLVVSTGRTRVAELSAAFRDLDLAGVTLTGLILNEVQRVGFLAGGALRDRSDTTGERVSARTEAASTAGAGKGRLRMAAWR